VVSEGAKLFLLEPEVDLVVGRLDGVGAVADVSADVDAEVTANGAWLRVGWLGCTEHLSASLDGVVSLPNHGANWAGVHVLDKTWEEWLLGQVSVVLLEVLLTWLADLHGDELEALFLEALEDFTDETTLNTVWLNHDEGSLLVGWGNRFGNLFLAFFLLWLLFLLFISRFILLLVLLLTALCLGLLLLANALILLSLEEFLGSNFIVRDELDTAHKWLEHVGNANTLCSLVVLHDAAHGTLSSAHSTVEHVHVKLVVNITLSKSYF